MGWRIDFPSSGDSVTEAKKMFLASVAMCAVCFILITWSFQPAWPYLQAWHCLAALICALAICLFIQGYLTPDPEPDFMRLLPLQKFGKDGFWICPVVTESREHGVAVMCVYYQNNFDSRCEGSFCFRAAPGLFSREGPDLNIIRFDIPCEPAEFGIASVAIGVPTALQDKNVTLEIGMTVRRETAWGRKLRFREWEFVRGDVHFQSKLIVFMRVGHLLHALHNPWYLFYELGSHHANTRVKLPQHVRSTIAEGLKPIIKTLWLPGQKPWVPDFELSRLRRAFLWLLRWV